MTNTTYLQAGKFIDPLSDAVCMGLMTSWSKRKDDLGIRWTEESCEEAKGAVGDVERLHRIV